MDGKERMEGNEIKVWSASKCKECKIRKAKKDTSTIYAMGLYYIIAKLFHITFNSYWIPSKLNL